MFVELALALQTRAAVSASRPTPAIDAATADVLARVRRKETEFFYLWRKEWEHSLAANASDLRLMSLHCHADGSWANMPAPHLITTPASRKAMCPVWLDVDEEKRPSEAVAIDNALSDGARTIVRDARANVLHLLDSAAVIAPEDGWVTGQRVRLNVDQRDYHRASFVAQHECKLNDAYCALLVGYVLAASGDWHGADAAYTYAVSLMTAKERCAYMDIRVFIDEKDRPAYDALDCAAREKVIARFWWLADPLYSDPGNERLTVHLYRETLILLHSALTADERFDWRPAYGAGATAEMLRRYGWPEFAYWDRTDDIEHFQWLGKYGDSSVNSSREYFLPRYHTTPSFAAAANPLAVDALVQDEIAPAWNPRRRKWDDDWWPVEHFARASPLIPLSYQVAAFQRTDGALVAVVVDPRSALLPDSVLPLYTAALVAMNGPTDSARRATGPATVRPTGATVLSMATTPGLQVISAEVFRTDVDSAPAARARFTLNAPLGLTAMGPGEVGVSDPTLFAPPGPTDSLPRSATDAVARMLPSTDLGRSARVGVFFEVYGLESGAQADVTLKVLQRDQAGLLRRIGARLGILDLGDGSIMLHWRDETPGVASSSFMVGAALVQSRAIVLDLSQLPAGHYALEIGVGRPGESPAVSRREFTIRSK
jgi:hypothetical protein